MRLRQRCPPLLHPDSLRCMRASRLLALRLRPTRSPLDNASLSDTPMSMPTAASLPGNIACSTSYVRLMKSLRPRSVTDNAFGVPSGSASPLRSLISGKPFDADDAIVVTRLEHRDIYIGKLDGVPAPAGLEARVARCLSATHPAIKRLPRPVSAAQNAAPDLNGYDTPEDITGAYRREFSVLAVQGHTDTRPVRPAPLFERRIIQSRALSQDFSNALISGLTGIRSLLVCLQDDHDGILSKHGFASQYGC